MLCVGEPVQPGPKRVPLTRGRTHGLPIDIEKANTPRLFVLTQLIGYS